MGAIRCDRTTLLALKRADPRFIRERFNVVLERLVCELRGLPCIPLEEASPDRKSIMASRSFGRPVETRDELAEAVATFTARAAEKLRGQGLAAGRIIVFVHTNRFRADEPQHQAVQPVGLPMATADTGALIAAAKRGLGAIYRPGYRYKKAGILLLDLVAAASVQGSLFDAADTALGGRYARDRCAEPALCP